MTRTTLEVRGMHCASCVSHVEKARAVRGVTAASVNLATERAAVDHDAAAAPVDALVKAVRAAGYEAHGNGRADPADPHQGHAQGHATDTVAWDRMLPAMGVLGAGVVVAAMGLPGSRASAWLQLALATPVQAVLGWPFYKGAFRAARRGRTDMDSLVALGTSVAYLYSLAVVLAGGKEVYFDTAAVILLLVGLGKFLELRARGSAGAAIRSLMDLQPPQATVIRSQQEQTISVADIERGDVLLVRPGQRVPVDGQVVEGRSNVDLSLVTGESMPVEVEPGSTVIGGSVNQSGAFRFKATRVGRETFLARVVELVENAQSSKAHVQRIADTVAGVFVPVVIAVSVLTLLGWGLIAGDWNGGMLAMVAVLIVACPCAMGLATPAAIMVGTGLGARHGILIKDAAALERAGRLTHVVLDKTGTLTVGMPGVTNVVAAEGWDANELLRMAASVEQNSEHPLGRSIVKYARQQGVPPVEVQGFQSVAGGGVLGRVEGKIVIVGRSPTLAERSVAGLEKLREERDRMGEKAKTVVTVGVDGQAAGLIALADPIKPGAAEAVAALHKLGLKVALMTGDNLAAAESVAAELGIDRVMAQVLPEDKQAKIESLRKQGAVVAMVGDGVNDAPALASADIGIAMGAAHAGDSTRGQAAGGTDVAMAAGHVVLAGGDLAALPRAIRLSRATMRRIYAGLFWAFIYNLVLIPLAAFRILPPMLAAAAMALSSVSVVLNALWLRWSFKP